jgi:hypothetical protein
MALFLLDFRSASFGFFSRDLLFLLVGRVRRSGIWFPIRVPSFDSCGDFRSSPGSAWVRSSSVKASTESPCSAVSYAIFSQHFPPVLLLDFSCRRQVACPALSFSSTRAQLGLAFLIFFLRAGRCSCRQESRACVLSPSPVRPCVYPAAAVLLGSLSFRLCDFAVSNLFACCAVLCTDCFSRQLSCVPSLAARCTFLMFASW